MSWRGAKIDEIAHQKGISKTKLANAIGISRQTINDWINGQIPKGHHLLEMAKILSVSPSIFFADDYQEDIIVPVHRQRKNAKITPEMQKAAIDLVKEYRLFFKHSINTPVVPVIRSTSNNINDARAIAYKLREYLNHTDIFPLDYKNTFKLLESLGIYVIFQDFPQDIKSYAFYTKIAGNRVVFVNNSTNLLDLIFPLLHEAIHALRDEVNPSSDYDENEEDFCDEVASYIQFTEEYIKMIYDMIKDLPDGKKINRLKDYGQRYSHSIHGVINRIQKTDSKFSLKAGGADTNLKKEFSTIGEVINSQSSVYKYLELLRNLTPLYMHAIQDQIEGISDRKLAFLLGTENTIDAELIRKELKTIKSGD